MKCSMIGFSFRSLQRLVVITHSIHSFLRLVRERTPRTVQALSSFACTPVVKWMELVEWAVKKGNSEENDCTTSRGKHFRYPLPDASNVFVGHSLRER